MSYSVACECGINYPVSLTDAGLPIDCTCGRSFYVPSLAKLRASAGESPVPLNTIETIQAMVHQGSLPTGETCPYSGEPANETVVFRVQCEAPWLGVRGPTFLQRFLLSLIFGGFWRLFLALNSEDTTECGRDTSVDVPLLISGNYRGKVIQLRNQSKLKAMLSKTPIYAKLLKEFPEATVQTLSTD